MSNDDRKFEAINNQEYMKKGYVSPASAIQKPAGQQQSQTQGTNKNEQK